MCASPLISSYKPYTASQLDMLLHDIALDLHACIDIPPSALDTLTKVGTLLENLAPQLSKDIPTPFIDAKARFLCYKALHACLQMQARKLNRNLGITLSLPNPAITAQIPNPSYPPFSVTPTQRSLSSHIPVTAAATSIVSLSLTRAPAPPIPTTEPAALRLLNSSSLVSSSTSTSTHLPLHDPAWIDHGSLSGFVGRAKFIHKQAAELAELNQLADARRWDLIQSRHYDWWMFGSTYPTTQHREYQLSPSDVEFLKRKPDYMRAYRTGVILVAKSWGWDLETCRDITNTTQRWTGYEVRLGKMLASLVLFGQKDLHDALLAFLFQHNVKLGPAWQSYLKPIPSAFTWNTSSTPPTSHRITSDVLPIAAAVPVSLSSSRTLVDSHIGSASATSSTLPTFVDVRKGTTGLTFAEWGAEARALIDQASSSPSPTLSHQFQALAQKYRTDINVHGSFTNECTALHYLAMKGKPLTFVEILAKLGADFTLQEEIGNTPVMWSIANANFRMTLELLKWGPKNKTSPKFYLNTQCNSHKNTALILALGKGRSGDHEIAKTLIDLGADVNLANNDGNTPLHFACLHANQPLIEYLIVRGANPDYLNNDGKTPADFLRMSHEEGVALLKKTVHYYSFPASSEELQREQITTQRAYDEFLRKFRSHPG